MCCYLCTSFLWRTQWGAHKNIFEVLSQSSLPPSLSLSLSLDLFVKLVCFQTLWVYDWIWNRLTFVLLPSSKLHIEKSGYEKLWKKIHDSLWSSSYLVVGLFCLGTVFFLLDVFYSWLKRMNGKVTKRCYSKDFSSTAETEIWASAFFSVNLSYLTQPES